MCIIFCKIRWNVDQVEEIGFMNKEHEDVIDLGCTVYIYIFFECKHYADRKKGCQIESITLFTYIYLNDQI